MDVSKAEEASRGGYDKGRNCQNTIDDAPCFGEICNLTQRLLSQRRGGIGSRFTHRESDAAGQGCPEAKVKNSERGPALAQQQPDSQIFTRQMPKENGHQNRS
jgi:hypothetical protein